MKLLLSVLIAAIATAAVGMLLAVTFNNPDTSVLVGTLSESFKIPQWVQWVAWFTVGGFVVLFVFPAIPGAVKLFVNNPNLYRNHADENGVYPVSRFGFFTMLQPGRVKVIERGERFVRCIMRYEGRCFAGKYGNMPYRSAKYWEVTDTPDGKKDTHPIPIMWPDTLMGSFLSFLFFPLLFVWWGWKRWVYFLTGAVFVGIYPFQQVRAYKIQRLVAIPRVEGGFDFKLKTDFSDHYRVADFQLWVEVPKADTKDKIEVRMHAALISRVNNPYETAYNTEDDWVQRTYSATSHGLTSFARVHSLDDVLSAKGRRNSEELGQFVLEIIRSGGSASLDEVGIKVTQIHLLDITPTDLEIQKKLGDVAVSKADKQATVNRLTGEAIGQKKLMDMYREDPVIGPLLLQMQGNRQVAEAAGDRAIITLGTVPGGLPPDSSSMMCKLVRNTEPAQEDGAKAVTKPERDQKGRSRKRAGKKASHKHTPSEE